MAPPIPRLALHLVDPARVVDGARHTPLTEAEYTTLTAAIDTLGYLAHLVEQTGCVRAPSRTGPDRRHRLRA